MRIAAFDFGSNSLKCQVAEIAGSQLKTMLDMRIHLRLTTALDGGGCIPRQFINQILQEVNGFQEKHLSILKPDKVLAIGTEALRKAKNSQELIDSLMANSGINLQVITPEEEAKLAWEGVTSGLPSQDSEILVFDSGGASTEFICGTGSQIDKTQSLPLGAAALTKDFISSYPTVPQVLKKMQNYIGRMLKSQLCDVFCHTFPAQIIGTGGGILACAKLISGSNVDNPSDLEGYKITTDSLKQLFIRLSPLSLPQLKNVPAMEPERADIILAAVLLYQSILQCLGYKQLSVCTRGVRQGLIYQYLSVNP